MLKIPKHDHSCLVQVFIERTIRSEVWTMLIYLMARCKKRRKGDVEENTHLHLVEAGRIICEGSELMFR